MYEWNDWDEPEYTEEEKEDYLENQRKKEERMEKWDRQDRKARSFKKKAGMALAFAAVFGMVFGGTFGAVKAISDRALAKESGKTTLTAQTETTEDQENAESTGIRPGTQNPAENEGRPERSDLTDGAQASGENAEAPEGLPEMPSAGDAQGELQTPPENGTAPAAPQSETEDNALLDDGSENGTDVPATTSSANGEYSVADVAENAMPAMVAITNTSVETVQDFFSGRTRSYESVSAGTGIIIGQSDSELMIATNAHVVSGAQELAVSFINEETAAGTVVGSDTENDLAVVAVRTSELSAETLDAIRVISIGDSDAARVGEQVVAIGNALGYGQSVSAGYLSAKDRGTEDNSSIGLLQTDAAINPGNSGGALLNMQGQLIGINSAKYSDTSVEGMGFAIPISYAKPILESMMNNGYDRDVTVGEDAAYLGIECYSVSEESALYYATPVGVLVQNVKAGSPAEIAGLQQADIITGVDGFTITDQETLVNVLTYYKAGDSATLTFARQDEYGAYQTYTTQVVFASRAAA